MSATLIQRLFAGLLVGLTVSVLVALMVVLPAVLIFRLGWGVWPTPAAWRWIAGVLAGQTLTLAVRHSLRAPATGDRPNHGGPSHGSSSP